MHQDTHQLIRRLIGGDPATAVDVLDAAVTSDDPRLLAAAALLSPSPSQLLVKARNNATDTRERQVVALMSAYLDGDADRVDALARDHLVDHPDDLLVAWIASNQALSNQDLEKS